MTVMCFLLQYKFSRFKNAARDMHNYRHDYPVNIVQQANENLHLLSGVYISEIHNNWRGDYYKLETVHTYIQWLFPLQEPGMNSRAILTEVLRFLQDFRRSDLAKENLLKSYKLMLDFYGIELEDETTGAVRRSARWEERFENLNRRTHNNLRITRILKCLGTLGYPHYQAPLVQFFLEQTLVHRQLPDVKESVLSYFMFAVLDRSERRKLVEFAYMNYTPKEEFVWCPKKIQRVWSRMQVEAPAAESDGDAEAGENKREELTDKTSFGGVVQSYPACRAFSEESGGAPASQEELGFNELQHTGEEKQQTRDTVSLQAPLPVWFLRLLKTTLPSLVSKMTVMCFLLQYKFSRFKNAARDMHNYRHDYPVSQTHTQLISIWKP
uniref:Opioid growth factor receptor 2 n=1 Tax=Kryptolebias marmoratus TaxID=37003 RepID=A0A3Q3B2X3_KRYMA